MKAQAPGPQLWPRQVPESVFGAWVATDIAVAYVIGTNPGRSPVRSYLGVDAGFATGQAKNLFPALAGFALFPLRRWP